MKIVNDWGNRLPTEIILLFARPAVAMLAWGTFLHLTDIHLPYIGYWGWFMLNIVAGIFHTYIPGVWNVKK